MGWTHITNFDNPASLAGDISFAGPKQQPAGKMSRQSAVVNGCARNWTNLA